MFLDGGPMESIQKKISLKRMQHSSDLIFMASHHNLRASNAFVYSLLTSQFPYPSLRKRPLPAA